MLNRFEVAATCALRAAVVGPVRAATNPAGTQRYPTQTLVHNDSTEPETLNSVRTVFAASAWKTRKVLVQNCIFHALAGKFGELDSAGVSEHSQWNR